MNTEEDDGNYQATGEMCSLRVTCALGSSKDDISIGGAAAAAAAASAAS